MDNEYFASINEVSKRLSVPAHTLRYWEKQFPVVIKPTTGAGGRRYYRAETVSRLAVIKDLLYTRGMTIAGVKKLLRDGTLPKSVDEIQAPADTPVAAQCDAAPARAEIELALSMLRKAREILSVS